MTKPCLQKVLWLTSQDVSMRARRETGGCWVMSEATSEVSTHSSQYRVSVCPEGVSAARGGRVLGFLFVLKVQYPASLRLLCSSYGFTALATVHTDESGFSTTFQFYRGPAGVRLPSPGLLYKPFIVYRHISVINARAKKGERMQEAVERLSVRGQYGDT